MPQQRELAKKLLQMFSKTKYRQNWDNFWEECAKYAAPEKDGVFDYNYNNTKGQQKHEQIYDASPIHYAEKLASALHSMLTNPNVLWFDLTSGDPALDKDTDVRKWLQKLVLKIHQIFNNSNFQTEIHQVYLDLAVFGTGSLRMMEDEELMIRFLSKPIYQYHVEENHLGEVDTIWHECKMTVRQALQKFGHEPFSYQKTAELKKDLMKEVRVLHVIMPRKDAVMNRLDAKNKRWASYHVLMDFETVLKESGFNEFPFAIPRWLKVSGERYGRSPTMAALADIKMLNEVMKDTIVAAQKSTSPPLMLPDDGIFGPVDIRPGGQNYYRSGTKDDIFPLDMGARPDIGINFLEDVRTRIKAFYFIDQLEVNPSRPEMTAYEVSERQNDNLRFLAPLLGRQEFELLKPLIGRTIAIMSRKGELPPEMPEQLRGRTPEVFYTSQIAKAQRTSEGQGLDRFVAQITPVAQMDPAVIDIINTDEFARISLRANSLPEELFHSEDKVKQTRDAKAAQAQQQIENEQSAVDSQNVKNVSQVATKAMEQSQ